MWAQQQTPPAHWHGLRAPLRRPYPGAPYSEVRAFTFGNDRAPARNRGWALLDRTVPGCGSGAIAKDGTLCPSVNPPGVALTADQTARLVAVLEDGQPRPGRPPVVTMCVPVPTLSFVFYDGTRPVAEMWLDTSCPFMGVHAEAARLYPEHYMAHAGPALDQLCRELALPGTGCAPTDPDLEAAFDAQARRDGPDVAHLRRRQIAIGVPVELKTSQLSRAQKERLCFDQAIENPRAWGGGLECPNGYRTYLVDPDTCVERFPSCEVSVGELVACQRHAFVDQCLDAPEAAHCLALLPCFFSRSTKVGPERRY